MGFTSEALGSFGDATTHMVIRPWDTCNSSIRNKKIYFRCNKKSFTTFVTCLSPLPTSPNNVEDQSLLSLPDFNIVGGGGWEGRDKNIST